MNEHEEPTIGLLERYFIAEPNTGCWIWFGQIWARGYGRFYFHGKKYSSHRLVYELLVGEIGAGLNLDHLCRNHWCVNPQHLEPVTVKTNVLRGCGPTAIHARKTHCIRGHLLTAENLQKDSRRWGRGNCKICHAEHCRKWRRRKREKNEERIF